MIPPVAPAVLNSNPHFEKVHKHIVDNLLDSDASTKAITESHKSTSEGLHAHRVSTAEDRILTASLFDLCSSDDLPRDLRDLILVTASYISDGSKLGLAGEEHDLMSGDAQAFRTRLDEITTALTTTLRSQCATLASIASAADEVDHASKIPIRGSRPIAYNSTSRQPELTAQVDLLLAKSQQVRSEAIHSAQYDASNTLILLLKSQSQYLQHMIRHLEQRKHGAEARHLVARAQFLSTVAQGLQAKTKTTYLEQRRGLYSPQLRQNLASKMIELEDEEEKMSDRKRNLQAALNEYEDAGGEVMRTLGKRYGEMEKEIEEVKRDIERLSENKAMGV